MKEIFRFRKGVTYGTGGAGEFVTELLKHKYFEFVVNKEGDIVMIIANNDDSDGDANNYHEL